MPTKLILLVLPLLCLVSAFTDASVVYGDHQILATGKWTEDTDCGYYTSTLHSSLSLTFNGVSIHVLGDLSLYGGIAQVTVDGQPQLIDLYGASSCGQVLFSKTGLANGQHSLHLELTGESLNVTSTSPILIVSEFIWSTFARNSSSSLSLLAQLEARQGPSTAPRPPPSAAAPAPTAPSPTAAPPKAPSPTAPSPIAPSPTAASPKAASPTAPSSIAPSPTAASPTAASPTAASPTAASPKAASPTAPSSIAPSPTAASPKAALTPGSATALPSSSGASSRASLGTSSGASSGPSSNSSSVASSKASSVASSKASSVVPSGAPSNSSSAASSKASSSGSSKASSSGSSKASSSGTSKASSSGTSKVSASPKALSTASSKASSKALPKASSSVSGFNSPDSGPPAPLTKVPSSSTSKYVPPPTSTLTPESVPTISAVATDPAPDISSVQQLWTCKPYGSNDCGFIPQAAAGLNTYSLIVGKPADNCGGGTANSFAVVGGQLTITDTWSQDLNAGISLGIQSSGLILNTSGTQLWENSESQQVAEVVKMTIPPNSQGALIAQVTYNSTNGVMQIGDASPFPVINNKPQNDVEYQANIVPCDAEFQGNYTPNYTPPSAATQNMKPYSYAMAVIGIFTVHVLL